MNPRSYEPHALFCNWRRWPSGYIASGRTALHAVRLAVEVIADEAARFHERGEADRVTWSLPQNYDQFYAWLVGDGLPGSAPDLIGVGKPWVFAKLAADGSGPDDYRSVYLLNHRSVNWDAIAREVEHARG